MQMLHVMTRHLETVRPGDMLMKAKEMMDAGGFRRLPPSSDRCSSDGRCFGRAWQRSNEPAGASWEPADPCASGTYEAEILTAGRRCSTCQ